MRRAAGVMLVSALAAAMSAAAVAADAPPPPVLGSSVDLTPVQGTVLIRLPAAATFQQLTAIEQVPVGTEVDASKGTVEVTSAADANGAAQTADFNGGRFVLQYAADLKDPTLTDTVLALSGGSFGVCGKRHLEATPVKPKSKKKKVRPKKPTSPTRAASSTTVVRGIWGSGKGNFRTVGRHAAVTVRGTIWLTQDRCDGTLASVKEGVVEVSDFVRNTVVTVSAGQTYVSKAPGLPAAPPPPPPAATPPPSPPSTAPAHDVAPTITAISNPTLVVGDGKTAAPRVEYTDPECDITGGVWIDTDGVSHDFGAPAGGNGGDAAYPFACHDGVGFATPGYATCTAPDGGPGTPGSYPNQIVLRDAAGNRSAPFTFYVICRPSARLTHRV